jgi:hypothetical protein
VGQFKRAPLGNSWRAPKLRPEAIKKVSDWAAYYRRFWEESFDKLDAVVNQMKKMELKDGKKHG